jgi:hypothetical protein
MVERREGVERMDDDDKKKKLVTRVQRERECESVEKARGSGKVRVGWMKAWERILLRSSPSYALAHQRERYGDGRQG